MKQSNELIWDEITQSAKNRFDFAAFSGAFDSMGSENAAENILFLTIAGHAAGDDPDRIAGDINNQLLPLGCALSKAELVRFISQRKEDLVIEIKAAKVAMDLLQMGLEAPGVLVQVRSILQRTQ